jgi:phytoene dehydrogenase-like protein
VCSAIHPLALASPFFRSLPLAELGLQMVQPATPLAHPFDTATAAALDRSLPATAAGLGRDGAAYARLMAPLLADWSGLLGDLLGPLRPPRHPITLLRFGLPALLPATVLARMVFRSMAARGLFAGLAAHSMLPLDRPITGAFGLIFGLLGHAVGWPIVVGGSQRLSDTLAGYLGALGGEVRTGWRVCALDELPPHRVVLLDLTPRQILRVAGNSLPAGYRRQLARFRYGPGVFKIDWALDGPIPWSAEACRRAGTVHLGASLDEIASAEAAVGRGEYPQRPFVLLAQQSVFDPTRAPPGRHTAWGYCHVPNGSTLNVAERVEAQVERFAPGFRQRILARCVLDAAEMERRNANHVGGDINGGLQDLGQLFTRPVPRIVPYTTPNPRVFICSSSTPPGGGVHGMCGYWAARAALRTLARP